MKNQKIVEKIHLTRDTFTIFQHVHLLVPGHGTSTIFAVGIIKYALKSETKSQNNSLKNLHENIVLLCIKGSQTKCKTQCALSNSSQKFYVLKNYFISTLFVIENN